MVWTYVSGMGMHCQTSARNRVDGRNVDGDQQQQQEEADRRRSRLGVDSR